MRKAAAKPAFIILTFNATFIDKSHGDIKRKCIILKPKLNAQLGWISPFSKLD